MESLSALGRLVQSILPRARRVAIFTGDGQLRWASGGHEIPDLRPLVAELLAKSEPDQSVGTARVEGAAAQYAFRIRGESGAVLGVLAFSFKGPFRRGEPKPSEVLEPKIAPLLAVLARDLERESALETLQQRADKTTRLERHRESGAGGTEPDPIEQLFANLVTELDADVVVASVPGHRLERHYVRPDCQLRDIDALRTAACGRIRHLAQTQGKPVLFNRSRLTPHSEPFRFVSVPIRHQDAAVGALTVFAAPSRHRIGSRDGRLLERLAPRLGELIELRVDSATELPTRAALQRYVATRLAGQSSTHCVIYLDVDQMHALNDLFGFNIGDEVLRRLAGLWPAGCINHDGLMASLSGDRFAAVLGRCTLNQGRAWAEAARIRVEQLVLPEACRGFKLSASFGVAMLEPGERFETALAYAATACRAAKDRGRNRVALFTRDDRSLLQRQDDLQVFRQVVGALEAQRFELLAQPIVPLCDPNRATHYELLVRLFDDTGAELEPGQFLSAATRYQLLPQLDRAVIQRALAELAPFAPVLEARRTICWINVAGLSVGQPDFADFARTMIKSSAIPGQLIGFEITEGAAIENLEAASRFIQRVRELGCSIALDDFGTGFSSLSYLKTLAVNAVKIDGAFIRDMLTDERSEALVSAVLEIARQLGFDTVVECVENADTAARLRTLGVTYGQGYHFARPRSFRDVLSDLAAAGSAVAAMPECA